MKESDRYLKIVEWSEEDGVYVGSCPGLGMGVHGKNERAVYGKLCDLVDELIALRKADGRSLPPPTAGWVTDRNDAFAAITAAMASGTVSPTYRARAGTPRPRAARRGRTARAAG